MKETSINKIRAENKNQLCALLMDVERATVAQLAEWSGLSVVTVTALTKELAEADRITQDSIIRPQLGRPAVAYRFTADHQLVLIIYMLERDGLDYAFFSVCDLRGDSVEDMQVQIEAPGLDSFDSVIGELLSRHPQIRQIGFGLPVGSEKQGYLLASDYPSLQNMPLRAHIEARFGIPTLMENDINAAALGYCHTHHCQAQCVISMFFPYKYTPGAGICLYGKLVKGRDGLAGACQYLPFAKDWQAHRSNPAQQCRIVAETIHMAMCLYNPDVVVLYWDRPAPDLMEQLELCSPCEIERLMIPEVVVSDQLQGDFKTGLIRLTLEALQARATLL